MRRLFDDGRLELIYRSAVRVLGEMGMKVQNAQCLEALERFGARVELSQERARFSEEVIDRMLEIVRADCAGWSPSRPMLSRQIGIGGGGCCPWYFDDDSGQRRRADEADCVEACKIVETSPVAASGVPVYNSDCPPKLEAIRCLQIAIETFNRTQVGGIDLFFPEQIPFAVELGQLMHGDPCRFLPAGNCPTSPLIVGKTIADLAVAKAPYKTHYAVPTMPIAGANAPITPAGTAVVGVAEILGGYILAKALNPETPVSATALSARMDMKTGNVVYVAPEVFVADIAMAEVFTRYLNLPCNTFGIYIDATAPGLQAVRERLFRSAALAIYGDLSGLEGTLAQGKLFSATQLTLDCDMAHFLADYTAEPVVSHETLGIEAILETGWDETGYMTHEHTIAHMREFWQAAIRVPEDADEQKCLAAARDMWRANLADYVPPDHSDDFLRDLRDICDRAAEALG